MSISPGADRVDLIAAINDGHLPPPGLVTRLVNQAYDRFKIDDSGTVADYIPALAAMPRDRFGISVVGVDGASYGIGDSQVEFSIQSVSKPFVFALICQAIGEDAAREKLGANNTGLPFNSVMALERIDEGTHNPMVNAGAIAAASLAPGDTAEANGSLFKSSYPGLRAAPSALTRRSTSLKRPPTSAIPASPNSCRPTIASSLTRWRPPMYTPSNAPSTSPPRIWR